MDIIYDIKTRDIVRHILELLGKKNISNQIKDKNLDIDIYINYIKYKCKKNKEISEIVDYFL